MGHTSTLFWAASVSTVRTMLSAEQQVRMTRGCGGVDQSNACCAYYIPAVGLIPHSVPKHVAQAILKQQPGRMSATLIADLLIVALQMLQTMKSEALLPASGSECVTPSSVRMETRGAQRISAPSST
jgi:hypothetical protein